MSNFDLNMISVCYLLNGTMDSYQTLYIVLLSHSEELVSIWCDPGLIFEVTILKRL